MTALRLLAFAAAAVVLAACAAPPPPPAAPDPRRAPASQDERMAWWRDARFGLFLHWGLYAIPAGKWRDHDGYGEWIRDSARIPREVYAEYQPNWNPTAFDADAWARMAKAAGMRYVVITSKHHDGFCLWDSEQTDWDVGRTPHGRDVLAPAAIRLLDGERPETLGPRLASQTSITWPEPRETEAGIEGEVIHVDAFGNLVTNLPAALWPRVEAAGGLAVGPHRVTTLVRTYGDAPAGTAVALVGSQGVIEAAVVEGRAADTLAARAGTAVGIGERKA
jgi:hypothetical protein